MRSKHFLSIASCGLLLTTVSCNTKSRVKSFVVDPELGLYNYAAPGDTLEFKALNPNTPPFYVIFGNPSPCVEKYLEVTKDKPGTCKVRTKTGSFSYGMSHHLPPSTDSNPHTCPQCKIFIVPVPVPPSGGPPQTTVPSSSSSPESSAKR